jgi:hypothetical protein
MARTSHRDTAMWKVLSELSVVRRDARVMKGAEGTVERAVSREKVSTGDRKPGPIASCEDERREDVLIFSRSA